MLRNISNVINRKELKEIEKIRKHRNLISHKPLELLIDENININRDLLTKAHKLLLKIEKWWILYSEIPLKPEFVGQEIDENHVKSGKTIYLDYIMEIVNNHLDKN